MILKELKIHNIASIEDATINFEASPLSESDVFLISGKTGSGKSTILDAISLALYNNTPRFANTQMQGNLIDGQDTITVGNPVQFLRRNTGKGFITLTFKGNNGVDYMAQWLVYRANNKPDGRLQSVKWILENLDTKQVISIKKEIADEIKKAVGLDFQQFCRTTMLAQGDFSKFLNSKDEEKSAILEKITGMDIYGRISIKVFEIYNEKKSAYEKLNDNINGREVYGEEKRAALKEEIKSLQERYDAIKKQIDSETEKKNWLKRDEEISKSILTLQKELERVESVIRGEEFQRKKKVVDDWNLSKDIRGKIERKTSDELKLQQTISSLASRLDSFKKFEKGVNFELERRDSLGDSLEVTEDFIESEKAHSKAYKSVDELLVLFKNYSDASNKIDEETSKYAAFEKKINEVLEPRAETLKNELESIKSKLSSKVTDRKDKEAELQALDLRNLREEVKQLGTDVVSLQLILDKHSSYLRACDNLKTKEGNLNTTKKELTEAEVKLKKLKKDLDEADKKSNEAKALYESQKDTVEKFAVSMRAKLHPGALCPVCRQKVDVIEESEETLKEIIRGYEKDMKQKQKDVESKQADINKLLAEIASSKKTIGEKEKEIDTDKEALNQQAKELDDSCAVFNLEPTNPHLAEEIQKLWNEKNDLKKAKDGVIKTGEKIENDLGTLRKDEEDLRKKMDAKTAEIQKLATEIANENVKGATSKNIISSKKQEKQELEEDIKLRLADDFTEECLKHPKEFSEDLKKRARKYEAAVKSKEDLEKEIKAINADLGQYDIQKNNILKLMPQWVEVKEVKAEELKNISDFAANLLASVSALITTVATLKQEIGEIDSATNEFLELHPDFDLSILKSLDEIQASSIKKIEESMEKVKTEKVGGEAQLRNENERYAAHQVNKPVIHPEEDTMESIDARIAEGNESQREISEKIGGIQGALDNDEKLQKELGKLLDELAQKKAEYDKWSRLNTLIGSRDGKEFRKIAQSYVLDSLVHSANHYLNMLSGRYSLMVKPNSFVISVADAFQGYVRRSAATLSGGETFLVSLSLALALSDIGGSLGVDTLFIDEGFGTLSGDHLQKAVTTLRSLHSKTGKHVGIISHIEELQEKIPVQIRVEQSGGSSSSHISIVP